MNEPQANRQSQVNEKLSQTNNAVEELADTVTELCSRLECVTAQEPPGTNAKAEGQPCKVLVPLADKINGLRDRIISQRGRLQSLLARLEL